jgi:hypothetical protein
VPVLQPFSGSFLYLLARCTRFSGNAKFQIELRICSVRAKAVQYFPPLRPASPPQEAFIVRGKAVERRSLAVPVIECSYPKITVLIATGSDRIRSICATLKIKTALLRSFIISHPLLLTSDCDFVTHFHGLHWIYYHVLPSSFYTQGLDIPGNLSVKPLDQKD